MRYRAALADTLSLGNGASGVAGVIILLAWSDPRALAVACVFVFIAWGFDSVDGLAARGVRRPPAEGIVLDSLCDVSSFGALPSVLLAAYGMRGGPAMSIISIFLAIVFVGCVILRLRRYTVDALDHASEARTSFSGVPSPVAAMSVAAAILAAVTGPPALSWMPLGFAAVTAPLMMSRIPYQETPRVAGWLARAKWPLAVLAAIAYFAGNVAVMLSVFFAAYLASGAASGARAHTPKRTQ
jgi:phosphatidylserine synthase